MPRSLGKLPAVIDPRVPTFHRMMSARIDPPPISNWFAAVPAWDMYANDNWGCCVPAAAFHGVVQRSTYFGAPVSFSLDNVVQTYRAWGGFDPLAAPDANGHNPTDQGCLMSAAMALWINGGVADENGAIDQPASYVTVNYKNLTMLQMSTALTGSNMIGIRCPKAWLETDYLMDVGADGTVGEIEDGHCMLIVGYKPERTLGGTVFDVISWGGRYAMTWRAGQQVLDEAYCVLDRDWFTSGTAGVDPAGVDWAALSAAMQPIMAG